MAWFPRNRLAKKLYFPLQPSHFSNKSMFEVLFIFALHYSFIIFNKHFVRANIMSSIPVASSRSLYFPPCRTLRISANIRYVSRILAYQLLALTLGHSIPEIKPCLFKHFPVFLTNFPHRSTLSQRTIMCLREFVRMKWLKLREKAGYDDSVKHCRQ